jgi:hypothetical protein
MVPSYSLKGYNKFKEKRTCLTLSAALPFPKEVCLRGNVRGNVIMLASKSRSDVILYKMEKEVIDAGNPIFFNQCFDKGRLKNFVLWFLLNYGESKTVQLVEQLKNVGFQYASKAGISLGIDDLKIPPKKNNLIYEAEKLTQAAVNKYASGEITGVERFQSLIDIWHRTSEFLKQEVINNFEATDILNPVYMMAFSGARGNISQVRQLVGMRGLMADPQGQIIDFPIRSNFREGLTLTEYIISSYGARKGIVDTALRTANAGYLTRRLVDVAQHVIISNFDCGTRRGIFLTNMKEGNKTIHSVSQRIVGRILARDLLKDSDSPNPIKIASRNDEVTLDLAFEIGKYFSKVFVRSALTCETPSGKQICQLCYGWSLAQGNLVSIGEAVGVVAAQSIGEPGTQLTMRTFHTGGVFSGDVSDQIKAPFDGVVEYEAAIPGTLIRTPEGRIAFLTKVEGYFYVHKPINNLDSNLFSTLLTSPKEILKTDGVFTNNFDKKFKESLFSESKQFKIPSLTLLYIKNGQTVYAKDVIAQISTISRKANASAGLAEEAELTIKSECEGQFYSKSLVLNEKEIGPSLPSTLTEAEEEKTTNIQEDSESIAIDKIYQSWTWGYAWILSGKIYEYKLPSLFFPKLGDFMNSKSYISQIEWKLNPSNGHNVFYDIHKRTPGNILNQKHYMSPLPSALLAPVRSALQKREPAQSAGQSSLPEGCWTPTGFEPSRREGGVQEAHQEKIGNSLLARFSLPFVRESNATVGTAKNAKKAIGLGSNESFNETLMCKAQSNSTLATRKVECENVSPMQSSQILFFDLTKILYKKYGYAFQLPEKTQFFQKSKIASLNNPYFTLALPISLPCQSKAVKEGQKESEKGIKESEIVAIAKGKSNKQTQKDLLFFIKSLKMLNTSNTRTELPYFLQWFPSKNQTLTGGYVLLETNSTMDSMISQKSHFLHKFNTSFFSPVSGLGLSPLPLTSLLQKVPQSGTLAACRLQKRTLPSLRTESVAQPAFGKGRLKNTLSPSSPTAKQAKKLNKNFYTRVTISTFTEVAQKVVKMLPALPVGSVAREGKLKDLGGMPPTTEGNENISLKLLSTLIKKNINQIQINLSSSLFTSSTGQTLSRFKKRKPALPSLRTGSVAQPAFGKGRVPVTSYSLEGQGIEVKKTEALESRVLWVSSSFFKIKLSSLTNCKTSLLFNTSKDSPLLYLTQPFEKLNFTNEQKGLLTPTLRAATSLTSEQEILTQKDEEVQEIKNTNLELPSPRFFAYGEPCPVRFSLGKSKSEGGKGKQSSIKKLNFLFFNKKIPMFLQTNRQGNIKGFQKYNFDSLPWGPANKHIQNPLETEGALLKLKVSNFLTSGSFARSAAEGSPAKAFFPPSLSEGGNSTLSTPSSLHISNSSRFVQSSRRLKSQGLCTEGTKRINDKKRKLSCFKQFEFANLTTYCRFANTSLSSLPLLTSLKFEKVLPKSETSKLEVKPQKHIKLPSVCASSSIKAKTRIYFGTFSTFTTLIDNSFNNSAISSLRNSPFGKRDSSKQLLCSPPSLRFSEGRKTMKQEKEIERNRSLFFNYFVYTKESNFFVSNYSEKEYKRFNKIQNKANFYSFMNQRLFQLTPCLQIHYIKDNTNRYIKANLFNALPTSIEKSKTIEALTPAVHSIHKKTELRRVKFVKKKASCFALPSPTEMEQAKKGISQSLVFSPSAYGALKKGWVVIPASSNISELWKLHKKRINPGQVLMDKMIFNMPILTECFLFNDIFNVENISLPKSFSFGSCTSFPPSLRAGQGEVRFFQIKSELCGVASTSTALVTNTKVQHLAQSAEDVNDLLAPRWVKNNKSRYFMSSPSYSHTSLSLTPHSAPTYALLPSGATERGGQSFEPILKGGVQAQEQGKEDGGVFESVKAQIESNSLIKNNVKIGLFIQPVEEYKKMSNSEFKNYVYESNSNTLNNLCKNIESFENSKIARFGCFASLSKTKFLNTVGVQNPSLRSVQPKGRKVFEKVACASPCSARSEGGSRDSNMSKKRSMLKAIKKKSISSLSAKLRAKAIQSRVNQSFDSLLNWQKYKYNLYNKQNRTLQPLAKFTQKDFSVFSVALWTERTKVLFEKNLSSLKNFNKASVGGTPPTSLLPKVPGTFAFALLPSAALRAKLQKRTSFATSSPKAKKLQAKKGKKVTNTTKKPGMQSGLKSNLPKEGLNPKKLSQNPLYIVSRKPLNLSPFLISFENLSYENQRTQRVSSLSEEIKNKKASLYVAKPLPPCKAGLLKPVHYQKVSFSSGKQTFTNPIIKGSKTVTSSLFLNNKKTAVLAAHRQVELPEEIQVVGGVPPTGFESAVSPTAKKGVQSSQKNTNLKGPSRKTNTNNPNKGYFNLSLSYQTYMVSYPPLSKFDSLLDPSLNQNLNLILSFYLNKTVFGACSSFNITNEVGERNVTPSELRGNQAALLNSKKDSNGLRSGALLTSPAVFEACPSLPRSSIFARSAPARSAGQSSLPEGCWTLRKSEQGREGGETQQTSKSSQHAVLALRAPSVKGTMVANSVYLNIKNLIQNVFESPCFSYNLTYPIDKFTLYKKAKMSGLRSSLFQRKSEQDGKMQNTQFFYSFPNNSLSGNREEIQSNKPFAQTNYASPFIGEVVYTNKNLLNFPSITEGFKKENSLLTKIDDFCSRRRLLTPFFAFPKEKRIAQPKGVQTVPVQEARKNRAQLESPLEKQRNRSFYEKSTTLNKQKPLAIKKSFAVHFCQSKSEVGDVPPTVSFEENTLDSLSSEKVPAPPLSYSCMFLTQKDLISFYLPSNNFKQSVNINYGKNYQINDILVKFLNMTENTDSENIIKQLESFVRITSPYPSRRERSEGEEDKTIVNEFTKMLSKRKDNFEIKIDKLEAGLPLFSASSFSKTQSIDKEIKNRDNKTLNMSLLGDFIMYGDPINNTKSAFAKGEDLREASGESLAAICANGQIIHYNNKKITLRRGQPIFISPKSILHKNDGEFIDPKTPVITLSYQKLKTGDIIQGIPKVEQFLEARTTKRGRLFRDSLPSLLKALFNRYQSKLPLELAVRQSFYKIQQIIVDGVQRVYKSQGVTIADKHLEVIVKQMTSKVRIIDGAQTGFFPGEIVDLNFVEKINKFLIKKITYEPLVLGITRASLEVDSFLSASSFQQTTRILSEAAIYKKKDFLKGLKENVILGNLMPAGTGYLVNQDDIYSKI